MTGCSGPGPACQGDGGEGGQVEAERGGGGGGALGKVAKEPQC